MASVRRPCWVDARIVQKTAYDVVTVTTAGRPLAPPSSRRCLVRNFALVSFWCAVPLRNFPAPVRREFDEKAQSYQAITPRIRGKIGTDLRKFPVSSLFNREPTAETGSLETACTASWSQRPQSLQPQFRVPARFAAFRGALCEHLHVCEPETAGEQTLSCTVGSFSLRPSWSVRIR